MRSGVALPTAIVLLVSAGIFLLALRIGRRLAPRPAKVLCTAAALAMLGFAILWHHDGLRIPQILPIADCMFYGDLMPPLTALLVGLAYHLLPPPRWKRLVLLIPLAVIMLGRSLFPLFADPPPLRSPQVRNGICQQTSLSSCTAAAAATLLNQNVIPATEAEMADLCLTTERGTTDLGLYRGLKLRARGTALDIRPIYATAAELRQLPRVQCVFSVGPSSALLPSPRHSLILLGFGPDGRPEIADPLSATRLTWSSAEFDHVWPGQGVGLRF